MPVFNDSPLSFLKDDELVELKWQKQDKDGDSHDGSSKAWSSKMGQMFKNRFQQVTRKDEQ